MHALDTGEYLCQAGFLKHTCISEVDEITFQISAWGAWIRYVLNKYVQANWRYVGSAFGIGSFTATEITYWGPFSGWNHSGLIFLGFSQCPDYFPKRHFTFCVECFNNNASLLNNSSVRSFGSWYLISLWRWEVYGAVFMGWTYFFRSTLSTTKKAMMFFKKHQAELQPSFPKTKW